MTHSPRKRFGQNFLHDNNIIYNILSSLEAKAGEHWVEIGPGLGALTEPLLRVGIRLDVVELDRDLVALLKDKFRQENNLQIHSADALKFDFSTLLCYSTRMNAHFFTSMAMPMAMTCGHGNLRLGN